ncbi:protein tramtrack, beta isoform-like isoform X16 [Bacillus rossius redtenbacheri]|uniref:protein tramtrack, beta isoform-like isoform X16 n=1 Tax=Bacillus rossius redtenbacheri TaxID=93214 RepID=UPI002FDD9D76
MKMTDAKSEHFSLRWDNFHSNLSTSFHTLLQGEELVDVTIAAEGHFVQAHKLVLSVCSPYFKSLFKVNPCKHPIVILKDVGHKELVDILEFMYRGEVDVSQEDLTEFLKTAEMLQVKGLTGEDSPGESGEQENVNKDMPVDPSPSPQSSKMKSMPKPSVKFVASARPSTPQTPIKAEEVVQPPPQKRMRQEQSQLSHKRHSPSLPHATLPQAPAPSRNPVSSTRESSKEVEFVEMPNPKAEPVEVDSDIEEVEATFDDGTDFSEFFGGQSSQSFQDFQGMGLPDGQSGSSQGMGMLQEGEQGGLRIVPGIRGKPSLVHDGYYYCVKNYDGERIYWRCTRREKTKCKARVYTEGGKIFVTHAKHKHPRDMSPGLKKSGFIEKHMK